MENEIRKKIEEIKSTLDKNVDNEYNNFMNKYHQNNEKYNNLNNIDDSYIDFEESDSENAIIINKNSVINKNTMTNNILGNEKYKNNNILNDKINNDISSVNCCLNCQNIFYKYLENIKIYLSSSINKEE